VSVCQAGRWSSKTLLSIRLTTFLSELDAKFLTTSSKRSAVENPDVIVCLLPATQVSVPVLELASGLSNAICKYYSLSQFCNSTRGYRTFESCRTSSTRLIISITFIVATVYSVRWYKEGVSPLLSYLTRPPYGVPINAVTSASGLTTLRPYTESPRTMSPKSVWLRRGSVFVICEANETAAEVPATIILRGLAFESVAPVEVADRPATVALAVVPLGSKLDT